jgi:hypothetical protein
LLLITMENLIERIKINISSYRYYLFYRL